MENLSIDLYSDTESAVSIDWAPDTIQAKDPEARRYADALLFACHAIRIFRNRDQFTDALAGLMPFVPSIPHKSAGFGWGLGPRGSLAYWRSESEQLAPKHQSGGIAVLDRHVIHTRDVPSEEGINPVYLVPHRGTGRRRLVATLKVADKGRPVFLLDYKGFGFFGKDVALLATDSVMILLAFLTEEHKRTQTFYTGIRLVAQACAEAYGTGRISMQNQEDLALEFVDRHLRGKS